jgi:hypothetical protein
LAKSRALAKDAILERKKSSGLPATIKSHALKVLERYVKKKICAQRPTALNRRSHR